MKRGPYRRTSLAVRFERHVDRSGGPDACHSWTGARGQRGYGRIARGGRDGGMITASRAAWEIAFGPIPDGLSVLHRCDNPPCCNERHLLLGTHDDNMADASTKGRVRNQNVTKTRCVNGHALDEVNTYRHRGERHCRRCRNEASKAYKARRRARGGR